VSHWHVPLSIYGESGQFVLENPYIQGMFFSIIFEHIDPESGGMEHGYGERADFAETPYFG
ncbi:MAG: hypothetical protein ACXVDF_24080, partial [Ktedonobacterales bacterium]